MNKAEIDAKLRADLQEKGTIEVMAGPFGPEDMNSNGYIEEITTPSTGGTFTKLYGCNYLFKGNPRKEKVLGIEFTKSLLFGDVLYYFVTDMKLVVLAAIVSYYLFPKRTKRFIEQFFSSVDGKVTRHYAIPETEYCEFVKELKWAIAPQTNLERYITNFLCLFLEQDTTYRSRVQDACTTPDPIKTLIDRENNAIMKAKWRRIQWALKLVPRARKRYEETVKRLNQKNVIFDDADKFFFYTYHTYNFGGLPYEERKKIVEELDKKAGNVRIYA